VSNRGQCCSSRPSTVTSRPWRSVRLAVWSAGFHSRAKPSAGPVLARRTSPPGLTAAGAAARGRGSPAATKRNFERCTTISRLESDQLVASATTARSGINRRRSRDARHFSRTPITRKSDASLPGNVDLELLGSRSGRRSKVNDAGVAVWLGCGGGEGGVGLGGRGPGGRTGRRCRRTSRSPSRRRWCWRCWGVVGARRR